MKKPLSFQIKTSRFLKTHKTILTFLIFSAIFCFSHPLNSDEGIVLNGAWKLYDGQRIYKDFFTFVAPGSFFWAEMSFFIFGPSYWSAKILAFLLFILSSIAIYKTTLELAKNKTSAQISAWIWLLIFATLGIFINYVSESAFLASIAVLFLIKAMKHKQIKYYIFSGLFLGLVIIFLQHVGISLSLFLGLLTFAYFVFKKISFKALLTFGCSTLILPVLTILSLGKNEVYFWLITWPAQHYLPFLPFSIPEAVLIFLTLVFFTYNLRRKVDQQALVVLFVAQIALYIPLYTRLDFFHVLAVSFPFTAILITYVSKLSIVNWIKKVNPTRYLMFKFVIFWVGVYLSMYILINNLATFIFINQFNAIADKYVIKELFAHPFLSGLYLERKAPDPYPYMFLFTGMHPASAFEQTLEILKKNNPKYVLTDYDLVEKYNYDKNNVLDEYIAQNYKRVDNFYSVIVLEKNE